MAVYLPANQDFIDIRGYSREELPGAPHNELRHRDMPTARHPDAAMSPRNSGV